MWPDEIVQTPFRNAITRRDNTEPFRRGSVVEFSFPQHKEPTMTASTSRRHLIESTVTAAALGAAAIAAGRAQAQPAPARKAATYSIKPLSFDPQKIKGLSERLLVSHYENNYSGAVKRLNAISEQIAALDP